MFKRSVSIVESVVASSAVTAPLCFVKQFVERIVALIELTLRSDHADQREIPSTSCGFGKKIFQRVTLS